MKELNVDVAILGSGFGGSLCALILEKMGKSVVLIDRASHPRFTIGESSTPAANLVWRDLCARYGLDRLRPLARYGRWKDSHPELDVGRKRGFSYFRHEAGAPFPPDPDHGNELLVAASKENYLCDTHWLRADIDAFLVGEVRRAGIPVYEGVEVVPEPVDARWSLTGRLSDGALKIDAAFVIDATGPAGVLNRVLFPDVRHEPSFRTHSRTLYAHFENVPLWHDTITAAGGRVADHPYDCDAAALHHILDDAWMWVLRFDSGVVSAGLVLDDRRYPLEPVRPVEEEWEAWMRRCPSLREQFAGARIVAPAGGMVRTGRLQRKARRAVGPNWAVLPFTAGFVDPLHSTGIAHTLAGIERLMEIMDAHWGRPTMAGALSVYQTVLFEEIALIDGIVSACYATMGDFRMFTASSMLYFAAVIAYEEHRLAGRHEASYLFASDSRMRKAVSGALHLLDEGVSADVFERYMEDAIKPFNSAGLLHPDIPNMYPHTAPSF